ncbi:metal-dependent hydrolase [Candidatus Dependentiae bacterium]|nr:metal-dependent hydrolase [Candidatus Dependentiae bacterium]
MKGLTHFMSAIAATTFIPEVVRMSTTMKLDNPEAVSGSFIILLAGAFGVMPDTMDFKLGQFFSIAENEEDPDPRNPDPQKIADAFAKAVNEAGDSGNPTKIQLYTIQLGASLWRKYNMIFENDGVIIQIDNIVKTSQCPIPGTAPKTNRVGRAKFKYELKSRTNQICWLNKSVQWLRHLLKGPDHPPGPVKPSSVEIFMGTQFEFRKESDGKIYFNWLPWHRTWSHSYVLGFMLSIPVFIIAYLLNLHNWWLYGLVANLGFIVHITEDMTGHIGGSLFWPLHKARSEGLELFKASDPRTNFSLDYAAIVMIIHNIDRFTTKLITMPWWLYYICFLIVPLTVYFWVVAVIKKKIQEKEKQVLKDFEEEPDGFGDATLD